MTDNEIKAVISDHVEKEDVLTCRDRHFASMICNRYNISILRYFQVVAEMAREGFRYA